MNIGEANDINTVARYFLSIPSYGGDPIAYEQARAALERLTQKAYKALSAGLTTEEIRSAFDRYTARRPIETEATLKQGLESGRRPR